MAYTIILIICIFAAFYSGFYFGYLKKEGKPPESMVSNVIHNLEQAAETIKAKKEEPSKEDLKANSFFN